MKIVIEPKELPLELWPRPWQPNPKAGNGDAKGGGLQAAITESDRRRENENDGPR